MSLNISTITHSPSLCSIPSIPSYTPSAFTPRVGSLAPTISEKLATFEEESKKALFKQNWQEITNTTSNIDLLSLFLKTQQKTKQLPNYLNDLIGVVNQTIKKWILPDLEDGSFKDFQAPFTVFAELLPKSPENFNQDIVEEELPIHINNWEKGIKHVKKTSFEHCEKQNKSRTALLLAGRTLLSTEEPFKKFSRDKGFLKLDFLLMNLIGQLKKTHNVCFKHTFNVQEFCKTLNRFPKKSVDMLIVRPSFESLGFLVLEPKQKGVKDWQIIHQSDRLKKCLNPLKDESQIGLLLTQKDQENLQTSLIQHFAYNAPKNSTTYIARKPFTEVRIINGKEIAFKKFFQNDDLTKKQSTYNFLENVDQVPTLAFFIIPFVFFTIQEILSLIKDRTGDPVPI